MDHDEVLEQLDLAAVEAGGLDRLTAGDTALAAAVVGHLAGCRRCAGEFERLTRVAPLVRDVVRTTPALDLRGRTLARVRAEGRRRGTDPVAPAMEPGPVPGRPPRRAWPGTQLPPALATAAAIVLAFAAGTLVAGPDRDRSAAQAQQLQGLQRIVSATLALSNDSGARRVTLAPLDGSASSGSLLFSPGSTDLVVLAEGLPTPPSGHEYRCWMDIDGRRANVGRMFFAGDLAFWVGKTPEVGEAVAGTTFGVSLTEVGGASLDADPVIGGDL